MAALITWTKNVGKPARPRAAAASATTAAEMAARTMVAGLPPREMTMPAASNEPPRVPTQWWYG